MTLENILTVADIGIGQFSPEFLAWINKECEPTYRDQELNEHLYNVDTILEMIEEDVDYAIDYKVVTALAEVKALCVENKVGYFRIVSI